ncbi:hypothetical protein RRF57_006098 [Xylaria bambusicola]|uniref:Uncharacterized protein n=1 Tax=Xylaria bambusicola TaxID=326684 RepID=A0AAN7Z8K6_9PEZI
MVWTHEKKTMDQAVVIWKVMFLSNWMMPLRGVCLAIEINVRHTGNRTKATSTWSTSAADLAIMYVGPNVLRAICKLSLTA